MGVDSGNKVKASVQLFFELQEMVYLLKCTRNNLRKSRNFQLCWKEKQMTIGLTVNAEHQVQNYLEFAKASNACG